MEEATWWKYNVRICYAGRAAIENNGKLLKCKKSLRYKTKVKFVQPFEADDADGEYEKTNEQR